MMTIRSHDQFNTSIYGLDDRYRGIHNGRRVVFLNAKTSLQAGLKRRADLVDLFSHFEGRRAHCASVRRRALQHSATLRRHLFSGDERAGAGAERGGEEQHAGVEVGGDQYSSRRVVLWRT